MEDAKKGNYPILILAEYGTEREVEQINLEIDKCEKKIIEKVVVGGEEPEQEVAIEPISNVVEEEDTEPVVIEKKDDFITFGLLGILLLLFVVIIVLGVTMWLGKKSKHF